MYFPYSFCQTLKYNHLKDYDVLNIGSIFAIRTVIFIYVSFPPFKVSRVTSCYFITQ